MEKMRRDIGQAVYFELQPLGRRPIPGRGLVSEDLGRTEFKTSPKKNSSKSSKHLQAFSPDEDDTNEDDLDLLPPLDTLSSPPPPVHSKSKASKKSQPSAVVTMKPPSSRPKVKPRPNFQGARALDSKEGNKAKTSFSFRDVMTSPYNSNQGARQRSPSQKAVHSTSPLEELSPNRIKTAKKSKGQREPRPFPMQDDCHAIQTNVKSHSPKRTRPGLEPFPMQDECHAAQTEVKSHSPKRTRPGPEPFPMEADCHAIRTVVKSQYSDRIRSGPAPFPMQDNYQGTQEDVKSHSSERTRSGPVTSPIPCSRKTSSSRLCTPSPPKNQSSCSKNNTARRVPQRFPLDIASSNVPPEDDDDNDDNDNDEDELALTDDDPHVITAYGGPRPFPMSLSQLLPETVDASGSKRGSEDGDEQRVTKRSRPSPEPNAFGDLSSLSLEDDSNVDPTTICPYCDEPWPSTPSPTLLSLLERTKRKSYADSRPGNTLGLKAPLAVFIEVCQRHRFEMTHLPLALERGWPTRLDFAGLPERIRGFREKLSRFIDHPVKSQFWREIRDDVKEVGKMKVVSVSGQYATFERCQPGYYGEQGSIIIHQTLYSLFSPDTIPLTSVDPLTPDQFLTRVLVPETAMLLIQEDMHLSTKEETMRVLDESKKYGVAMFPEQAQGDEVAEIGERLAKERAKERRKILEKRGEADADVKREVERECRKARRVVKKRGHQSDTESKGTVTVSESDADHGGENELESSASTRKGNAIAKSLHSKMPNVKERLKWRDESRDASMQDTTSELTPRPLKGGAQKRSSSINSGRSRHSPSSSLNRHHCLDSASRSPSLHKSSCKPGSPPTRPLIRENIRDTQWVFNLQDDDSSLYCSDVDLDEMTTWGENQEKAEESSNPDSDVVVIEDELTPKSKPNRRQMPSRNVHRLIANESSDSDVPTKKATLKVDGHEDAAGGGSLGQTKRKRKGKSKDQSTESDAGSSTHRSSRTGRH